MDMQIDYWELTYPQDQQDMKENAIVIWMEYLLICGSKQSKYGTITKVFVYQYSLVNNQYPRSITTDTNALSNQKIDTRYYENQKSNRDKSRSNCDNHDADNEGNPTRFFPEVNYLLLMW